MQKNSFQDISPQIFLYVISYKHILEIVLEERFR